ncbi:hypothetical protein Lal_00039093 [Lupinus albus]|nr:hypothetical protein Lal_00039093 [Lupinus albus]
MTIAEGSSGPDGLSFKFFKEFCCRSISLYCLNSCTRLKKVMGFLVSYSKSAFIQGCSSLMQLW